MSPRSCYNAACASGGVGQVLDLAFPIHRRWWAAVSRMEPNHSNCFCYTLGVLLIKVLMLLQQDGFNAVYCLTFCDLGILIVPEIHPSYETLILMTKKLISVVLCL